MESTHRVRLQLRGRLVMQTGSTHQVWLQLRGRLGLKTGFTHQVRSQVRGRLGLKTGSGWLGNKSGGDKGETGVENRIRVVG